MEQEQEGLASDYVSICALLFWTARLLFVSACLPIGAVVFTSVCLQGHANVQHEFLSPLSTWRAGQGREGAHRLWACM